MPLKAFHIVFIVLSICLAFWVSAWAFSRNGSDPDQPLWWMGLFSTLLGLVLVLYGIWFYRKSRRL